MSDRNALMNYITGCQGILDLKLCQVSIGVQQWTAARYKQMRSHEGHSYTVEQIYCVGELPTLYTAKRFRTRDGDTAICFTLEGRDWYVAGYFDKDATEMQPLGRTFILMPWEHADPIDKYSSKPYFRMSVEITD